MAPHTQPDIPVETLLQERKAGIPQGSVIVLISLLPMMAIVALMPVVPAIVQNFQDIPNIMTLAPLVLSAPGLCVALFSPFAGYLTDRLGRRNLLLIFSLLYGVGGILPFFQTAFPMLMAGRLILGIGEAFILTIANTLYGDYFSVEGRTRWLMIQGIVGSVAGTGVLALSGTLATFGWNYPFLSYSIAFIVTIGTLLFIFEPQKLAPPVRTAASPAPAGWPVFTIVRLCLITLVAAILYFVYTLHFSLALDAIGITNRQQIGNISAIASIAVPVGALLFKWSSRYTIRIQLSLVAALLGTGLVGIGLNTTTVGLTAFAWIQQLGAGMAIPTLIAWALNCLPAEFRGRGMGFWTSAFFFGQFVSPFVVGAVRGWTGGILPAFLALGAVCLVLAVVNFVLNTGAQAGDHGR